MRCHAVSVVVSPAAVLIIAGSVLAKGLAGKTVNIDDLLLVINSWDRVREAR